MKKFKKGDVVTVAHKKDCKGCVLKITRNYYNTYYDAITIKAPLKNCLPNRICFLDVDDIEHIYYKSLYYKMKIRRKK